MDATASAKKKRATRSSARKRKAPAASSSKTPAAAARSFKRSKKKPPVSQVEVEDPIQPIPLMFDDDDEEEDGEEGGKNVGAKKEKPRRKSSIRRYTTLVEALREPPDSGGLRPVHRLPGWPFSNDEDGKETELIQARKVHEDDNEDNFVDEVGVSEQEDDVVVPAPRRSARSASKRSSSRLAARSKRSPAIAAAKRKTETPRRAKRTSRGGSKIAGAPKSTKRSKSKTPLVNRGPESEMMKAASRVQAYWAKQEAKEEDNITLVVRVTRRVKDFASTRKGVLVLLVSCLVLIFALVIPGIMQTPNIVVSQPPLIGGIDTAGMSKQKAEAERIAVEKAEVERIAAEKAEAERIAAEKAEAERIAAEKVEAERIAAEKAEAERIAAEKAEAERIAAEKAEAERIAAEKAEAERIAAEKAEAERIAAEAEAERVAAEKAEAERVAAEKAEAERIAAEKAEAERVAAEKAEAERIAAEKAEAERVAAEKAEAERVAAEKAEKIRLLREADEEEHARSSLRDVALFPSGLTVLHDSEFTSATYSDSYKYMSIGELGTSVSSSLFSSSVAFATHLVKTTGNIAGNVASLFLPSYFVRYRLDQHALRQSESGPDIVFTKTNPDRGCWRLDGDQGYVSLYMATPVAVDYLAYEHDRSLLGDAVPRECTPKHIQLSGIELDTDCMQSMRVRMAQGISFGKDDDGKELRYSLRVPPIMMPTWYQASSELFRRFVSATRASVAIDAASETLQSVLASISDDVVSFSRADRRKCRNNATVVAELVYDDNGDRIQTARVHSKHRDRPFDVYRVEVLGNYGSKEFTCVHRVKLLRNSPTGSEGATNGRPWNFRFFKQNMIICMYIFELFFNI